MVEKQLETFPCLTARFYGYYDSYCGTLFIHVFIMALWDSESFFFSQFVYVIRFYYKPHNAKLLLLSIQYEDTVAALSLLQSEQ